MQSTMRRLLLFVAITIATSAATRTAITAFQYRSYGEIVDRLLELEIAYPEYAEVFTVQGKYSLPLRDELQCTRGSTSEPCKQYVIKITNESSLPDPQRPEVFFSGALHGNERVGPQAVVALAELLLTHASRSDGNPWIKFLVATRTVVIMPTANAHGYDRNAREELGVDPNRDFPYNTGNGACMETMAARALNELWRDHLFQLAITFHGGTRCISYEWGGENHASNRFGSSEKSPDDRGQAQLALLMSRFGGVFENGGGYYPDGTMNDVVYAVNGGMEDWGYASSWENAFTTPKPTGVCNPRTFDGYPAAKTTYNNATHRAFNMLIETSYSKQPRESSLGNSDSLSDTALGDYLPAERTVGHVPRNVRLALLYIDLVQPYLLWSTSPLNATAQVATTFEWEVSGSISVDSTQLKVWKQLDDPAQATLTTKQSGVTRWYHKDLDTSVSGENKGFFKENVTFPSAGVYHVQAVSTVDQSWATQGTGKEVPVPNVKPQTHVVNARTNADWSFSNNERVVQGQTEWSSPVVIVVVT